jgi:competence protein ComEC
MTPSPDLLITGDGHHVGIVGEGPEGGGGERALLMLRTTRGDYTRSTLMESAGLDGRRARSTPGPARNAMPISAAWSCAGQGGPMPS